MHLNPDEMEVQGVMRDLALQTLARYADRKRNGASTAQKKYIHGFHFKEVDEQEVSDALR